MKGHDQAPRRSNQRMWPVRPHRPWCPPKFRRRRPQSPKKKKKQKKDAGLEKFRLEQREAKAKEMSKIKHRKLQHEQDFQGVWNYRKSIHDALLESINGADHQDYLKERFQKENNYMSKKSGHKWNLMTVECLLTRIAKYANEPTKRLKEAQQIIKSNFPMVLGMPSGDKCTPEFVVWVLMDCEGNLIDCHHQAYGKEQNIRLHDVISPAAMARVTAQETYIVDGIPTTIKVDNAFCPFCAYTASNHLGDQQPRSDAFPSHTGVWVARLLLRTHAIEENGRT